MLSLLRDVEDRESISILGKRELPFRLKENLLFSGVVLDFHSNALRFTATDTDGNEILTRIYYSVGGGFVVDETASSTDRIVPDTTQLAYPFQTGNDLLQLCEDNGFSISTLMLKNESAWRTEQETRSKLLQIWSVMEACVSRGCQEEGILPGGLKVKRRAAHMFRKLQTDFLPTTIFSTAAWTGSICGHSPLMKRNAAGGRVVTAPTNGAAGIIPAVLHYYRRFLQGLQ